MSSLNSLRGLTACKIGTGALVLALAPAAAQAQTFAYEGFNNPSINGVPSVSAPDNTTLPGIAPSGSGWSGTWTVSNGNSNDSVFKSAGLSFPASYPGSYTAVGGSAINKGNTANSMLRLNLDAGVAASVNSGQPIYVSFLGLRQGQVTPETGLDGLAAPGTYMNPYPRNAGARFPSQVAANNNTSLGLFGGNGNAAENNGWGAWGFKDTNGLMSGAPFTAEADFIVARLNPANSQITIWVNPQLDGTADGMVSFINTDGGNPVNISLYAFGVEAGSGNASRAPGEWAFDEIRIAGSFADAAGFTAVPEPTTYAAMFGLLALGVVAIRRRRKTSIA